MVGALLVGHFLGIQREVSADVQAQTLSGTVSSAFYATNKESSTHSWVLVLAHQVNNGTV